MHTRTVTPARDGVALPDALAAAQRTARTLSARVMREGATMSAAEYADTLAHLDDADREVARLQAQLTWSALAA